MNSQTTCRICLSDNPGMRSIFDYYYFSAHNREICKAITDCASIQIQKFDGFSERICQICLDLLTQAYSFKKLCEDSDYKLRNDLIAIPKVEMKNEYFEEEAEINFGEIRESNNPRNCKINDVTLIHVKNEQCSDEIKTENHQDELEKDSPELLNVLFESTKCEEQSVNHDTPEQPYKCDKEFSRKYQLVNHSRVHTGEKPHTCHICNKTFTQKCNLVKHIRLHTGENAFKCDICGKKVSTKQTLVEHIRSHTGEKPYKCNFCDKNFSRKYHLICHSRIHTGETPYKCEFCEKKFTTKQMLVEHSRNHNGEQPYKCDLCDKKYTRKYRLVDHSRSHTGEKPYECEICETKFAQVGNLVRHRKRTHGIESVSIQ